MHRVRLHLLRWQGCELALANKIAEVMGVTNSSCIVGNIPFRLLLLWHAVDGRNTIILDL